MKVIGITGTMGSGKEFVRDMIAKNFSNYSVSLSTVLRTASKGMKNADRKSLQDLGNELRQKYGNHILAKLAVDYLQRDKEVIIIDGIRNPGEVDYLRKTFGKNYILVAVDANEKIRFERITKRNREGDPKSWEEFQKFDERDQGKGEPPFGQHVKKCIEMADIVIRNDGNDEVMNKDVEEAIKRISG